MQIDVSMVIFDKESYNFISLSMFNICVSKSIQNSKVLEIQKYALEEISLLFKILFFKTGVF